MNRYRQEHRGFSLLELQLVLVIAVLFVGGGLFWAYSTSADARRANQLVELAASVRSVAIAEATTATAAMAGDAAGTYAGLNDDWLAVHLDARWLHKGAVVVPVPGVGFSVSGARSPWGALPSMSLDVGRVRMTNVPSELCPTVAIGVIRGFDRVVINGNVAHDAGLTPISQSQILAWCAATPTLTFEVFFA